MIGVGKQNNSFYNKIYNIKKLVDDKDTKLDFLTNKNEYLDSYSINLIPKYNFSINLSDFFFKLNNFSKNVVKMLDFTRLSRNFINVRIKSIEEVKEVEIKTNSISIANTDIKIPTGIDSFTFNITFFADDSNLAKKIYYEWISMIINRYNLKNPRGVYECDLFVQVRDKNYQMVETRVFHNCFPYVISASSYDKDLKEFQEDIKITFQCNGGMKILLA